MLYLITTNQATKGEKTMARKRMVTRTILTTKVNALCMDTVTCEACNKDVVLPRTFKDNDKVLKATKSVLDTPTFKVVDIVDVSTVETLYGMDEQKFINESVILDPTTRKQVDIVDVTADYDEETEDAE